MRPAARAIDVAAVVLFVAIGRAAHHHADSVAGFASTLWPFAAGVAVGWLVLARRALVSVRDGLVICVATVAVGMVLRVVAGQGTAAAFVAVSLGFLGAVMVGGRLLLTAGRRLLSPPR